MKHLSNHFLGTYTAMRLTLCALGFLMPVVLMTGGKLRSDIPAPTHSMSAYYHLNGPPEHVGNSNDYTNIPKEHGTMRDWFVGFLFALGVLLFAYKGYSVKENWALNIAGIAAWCVALFPMSWPPVDKDGFSVSMHGGSAALLFACISYVCIFRSGDTLIDPAIKARYRRKYLVLGWAMGFFPVIAWILNSLIGSKDTWTFWLEATGVWIFAAFWGVKTLELWDGQIEEQIMRGELDHAEEGVPLLKSSPLRRVKK